MDKIPLEYLVETIAKALCFENYVALHNIEDFEKIDLNEAIEYYDEHEDKYLHKSFELLTLFHNFSKEEISSTVH